MKKITTYSEEETKKVARKIAQTIKNNEIIILNGELGAGKTKFTEGFLEYFGLNKEISSPTFNIVNEYKNKKISIFHFDVYRLNDIEEFYAIGGEEYFDKGICIIEWGNIIKEALPNNYIEINIKIDDNDLNKRIIFIEKINNK